VFGGHQFADCLGRDISHITTPGVESGAFGQVEVDARHTETGPSELDSQRQAHIAETGDANAGRTIDDLGYQFASRGLTRRDGSAMLRQFIHSV